ncbi:response regulator transcription factor [Treponema sp. OttesenSCG-928-L16]|nr:response regulator transcription factor [Treponema sp. OttesenSCG-928-L16]
MSRIAVVDDEKHIREVIRLALEKEYHLVDEYPDGQSAWEQFQREMPELIILDILMPRMDGMELCKKLKSLPQGPGVPVIFLSSRDEEIDKVLGLESGADDYVCKPFSLRELIARVKAGLRRKQYFESPVNQNDIPVSAHFSAAAAAFKCGPLLMDENRHFVSWKNIPLDLTVTEFRILKSLVSYPGYIKNREQLMAAAFPEDNFPNDRAADSHIKRIRKKFQELDAGFDEVEAVYGLGYRWRKEE